MLEDDSLEWWEQYGDWPFASDRERYHREVTGPDQLTQAERDELNNWLDHIRATAMPVSDESYPLESWGDDEGQD